MEPWDLLRTWPEEASTASAVRAIMMVTMTITKWSDHNDIVERMDEDAKGNPGV
jgi:hypothetical protein